MPEPRDRERESENRQAYRRGSDLEIRALHEDARRVSDMLIRHERDIHEIREDHSILKTLILGAEGQGGLLAEVRHIGDSLDALPEALMNKVDRIRMWAIGCVFTFVVGATSIVLTLALSGHH